MEGEAVATHEWWAFVGSIEKIDLLTENFSYSDLFQWFTRESCYDIYMLCLVIGIDFYYPYSYLLLFFWNFLPCPFHQIISTHCWPGCNYWEGRNMYAQLRGSELGGGEKEGDRDAYQEKNFQGWISAVYSLCLCEFPLLIILKGSMGEII